MSDQNDKQTAKAPSIAPKPPTVAQIARTVAAPKVPPPPPTLAKPWNLRNIRLPRAEMNDAIDAAQSVPTEAKTFLKALVSNLDKGVSLVQLDAHGFASPTTINIHCTVAKL